MEHAAAIGLRWGGRILILVAVFVLVSAFFLPSAIQPLNGVVCPTGTELANSRYASPNGPDNERLEVVCTSSTNTESAAKKLGLVVVGLVAAGLLALYTSQRMLQPRYRLPDSPAAR